MGPIILTCGTARLAPGAPMSIQSRMTARMMKSLIIALLMGLLAACAMDARPEGAETPIDPASLFRPDSVMLGRLTEGRSEPFSLTLTNMSGRRVAVSEIVPSCGCTVVEFNRDAIAPGGTLNITGHIDTTGKVGLIDKSLSIYTNLAPEPFMVSLRADVVHDGSSVKDVNTATLFKGDCASCHSPKGSPTGEQLYKQICLMCHRQGLSQNAAMDKGALVSIISEGLRGTSMPAYATSKEGPLTNAQIASLAEYILQCLNSSSHPDDTPGAGLVTPSGLLDSSGGLLIETPGSKGLCAEGSQTPGAQAPGSQAPSP